MEQILPQKQRFVIRVVYNPLNSHHIIPREDNNLTQNDKIPLKYDNNFKKKRRKKYGHPSFLRVFTQKDKKFYKKVNDCFFFKGL